MWRKICLGRHCQVKPISLAFFAPHLQETWQIHELLGKMMAAWFIANRWNSSTALAVVRHGEKYSVWYVAGWARRTAGRQRGVVYSNAVRRTDVWRWLLSSSTDIYTWPIPTHAIKQTRFDASACYELCLANQPTNQHAAAGFLSTTTDDNRLSKLLRLLINQLSNYG